MSDTPYASDVKGQLLRVPGATSTAPEKFNGLTSRAVAVPLLSILDGERREPVDLTGDDIPF
jgi:hypothetical protein